MSGHYRTLTYFTLGAIALSLLFSCAAEAKDKDPQLTQETVLHETMALPVDGALDSEGNPLAIPDNPTGALNYRASHARPKSRRDKKSPSKSKSKRSKKQNRKTPSRKQQLASRQHVADDPNCRWLDKRMSHLEKSLKRQAKRQYGYQDKELRVRQSEWVCMKCGAEGPSQSDHHKCQYRR